MSPAAYLYWGEHVDLKKSRLWLEHHGEDFNLVLTRLTMLVVELVLQDKSWSLLSLMKQSIRTLEDANFEVLVLQVSRLPQKILKAKYVTVKGTFHSRERQLNSAGEYMQQMQILQQHADDFSAYARYSSAQNW